MTPQSLVALNITRQISEMVRPAIDIAALTVAERLALIEELWASLGSRMHSLELTTAQAALIAERQTEHAQDPNGALTWASVRAELLADQQNDERSRTEPRPASEK